jgi:NAD(P)-dependent dehydrogenase (short-subunit alcohol dehydrogenase family)
MSNNPFSLDGKTILVTGASSGIGKATAIECSKLGARVIITGRNEVRLQETLSLLQGEGHLAIVADLSDEESLGRLVDQCPEINGLVNNAGSTIMIPTQFISRDKLMQVLEVNTIAPILLTQQLLKKKKLGKGASVVITDSISGVKIASPGNVLYSTSKSAINGFVKNAALDLAGKSIRVNAVCPGMISTHILDNGSVTTEDIESDMKKYPLKRYGKPEEVAYAIIYFLSDASGFTTGANLVIDGGFTLQ